MGYEYRIRVALPITRLEKVSASLFASSEWRTIPGSLIDTPGSMGVQFGNDPVNLSWPHKADQTQCQ